MLCVHGFMLRARSEYVAEHVCDDILRQQIGRACPVSFWVTVCVFVAIFRKRFMLKLHALSRIFRRKKVHVKVVLQFSDTLTKFI